MLNQKQKTKGTFMWLFTRRPRTQNSALGELALIFKSPELAANNPTPGIELLDITRLDFSVESLELVDHYLEQMRAQTLDHEAAFKLVLRCGAYVGEVIMHNSHPKTYHWLEYKEALKVNRDIADFGESLGTMAILWDGDTGLTFPLEKVVKSLENGREDSMQFFAKAMLAKNGG